MCYSIGNMATRSLLVALLLVCYMGCRPSSAVVIQPSQDLHIEQPVPAPEPIKDSPPVTTPVSAPIDPRAKSLIVEFEGFDHRPAWPEGASGVTVALGYDCGYYKRSVIESDWSELQSSWRSRLGDQSGITGRAAQARIAGLRDIYINTEIGERVFDKVDVPREYDNCKRAFHGFEDLRPSAQGALISLGYNRGYGMTGDSRREMRNIRDLVPKKDYTGMANEIRKMKRLWYGKGLDGLLRRRDAEARLMESE